MRKSRSAHVKCDCGERHAALKESAKGGKPVSSAGGCHSGIAPAQEGEGKGVFLVALDWGGADGS